MRTLTLITMLLAGCVPAVEPTPVPPDTGADIDTGAVVDLDLAFSSDDPLDLAHDDPGPPEATWVTAVYLCNDTQSDDDWWVFVAAFTSPVGRVLWVEATVASTDFGLDATHPAPPIYDHWTGGGWASDLGVDCSDPLAIDVTVRSDDGATVIADEAGHAH